MRYNPVRKPEHGHTVAMPSSGSDLVRFLLAYTCVLVALAFCDFMSVQDGANVKSLHTDDSTWHFDYIQGLVAAACDIAYTLMSLVQLVAHSSRYTLQTHVWLPCCKSLL